MSTVTLNTTMTIIEETQEYTKREIIKNVDAPTIDDVNDDLHEWLNDVFFERSEGDGFFATINDCPEMPDLVGVTYEMC